MKTPIQKDSSTPQGRKPRTSEQGRVPFYRGDDKVIAGVCSGMAQRYDVDTVVVRVTWVVLFLCTAGLIAIPYLVFALTLPNEPRDAHVTEVNPVSVASDKYSQVVAAKKTPQAGSMEQYGVQADVAHMPPRPPQGEGVKVNSKPAYIAYNHTEDSFVPFHSYPRRGLVALAVAVAATLIFAVAINLFTLRHPDQSLWNFWPVLFVVVGIVFLVCFYDRVSLGLRLGTMLLMFEICCALLPFTMDICSVWALGRVGAKAIFLFALGVVFVAWSYVHRTGIGLLLGVGVLAIAFCFVASDIGLFDRLIYAESYAHHHIISPLFRA